MEQSKLIINPKTGKKIKIGGRTHLRLVQENILEATTLETGKISIVEGSRQKMPKVNIEKHNKTTHWTNIKEIADAIGCEVFELIAYFTKEYDEMKICIVGENVRIIFPHREIFIQETVFDFVKEYSIKNKYDLNYWNQ